MTKKQAVAIVCPFSTGELLAQRVRDLGHGLVLVFTAPKDENNFVLSSSIEGDATVYHRGSLMETVNELKDLNHFEIVQVLPGAENGVCLANELAHALELVHNNLSLRKARRSKFLMQETIRAAGVRATKQTIATEWQVVEEFITEWNPSPFKVIVKPNSSAGSDDVFLCENIQQVQAAFDAINGAINSIGEVNDGVLIQEFLAGKEYVVDSVSRDGKHKVVAIWEYDKRHLNGQFNVYCGMKLRAVSGELERQLVAYNQEILDALEIHHGPSHAEIMMTSTGPCLVEVGARCHGGHGSWLPIVDAAFGYNQVNATVDSYLNEEAFQALPDFPCASFQKSFGREVFLVSYREGKIQSIPGLDKVKALKSYLEIDMSVKVGDRLEKTVDLFTMPGRVQLLHDCPDQVDRDYNKVHQLLENHEMFEIFSDKALEAIAEDGPAE